MLYRATVVTSEGLRKSVEQEASTRLEAGKLLKNGGVSVLSIEEVSAPRSLVLPSFISGRISTRDRIVFARNLAAMLSAGMPLARSLSSLESQAPLGAFKETLQKLGRSVERGQSLSAALSECGNVFSGVFVAMVHAGEESGGLPNALTIVADQLDKSSQLQKKIRGALIYPGIILSAMVLVGIVMMVYVVPTLVGTFKEIGVELPLSTQILVAVSGFIADHVLLLLLVGVFAIVGALKALKTPEAKRTLDAVFLRLPAVKGIVQQVNAAITARTISSLITAGVDMVETLTIASSVHSNTLYRDVLLSAAKQVQSGAPLSAVLRNNTRLYPVLLASVAEVGEETGKLGTMFMSTALFYEEEVDRLTKNLSTIIEPVLMVIIGAAVGFFAISMISPMYSVVDQL